MSQVRIVTDSAADVPASLAAELDIAVVPLQVHVGHVAYQNGTDLQPQTFYDRLALSDELAEISQPPLDRFVSTYRRLLDKEPGDAVVSIHVAGSLGRTADAAWSACQMLPDPSRVEIIDTGQISMGLGWVAVEAARLAQAGATRAVVSKAVRDLLPRVRMAAMIDSLEDLRQAGRISLISEALGTALQVKPLVNLQDGEFILGERIRTQTKALKHLVEQTRGWKPLVEIAVLHTGAEKLAQYLAEAVHDLVPTGRMIVIPAGPALTAYLGLGMVGVAAVKAAGSRGLSLR